MIDFKAALPTPSAPDAGTALIPPVDHAEPIVGGSYARNPETGALTLRKSVQVNKPNQE